MPSNLSSSLITKFLNAGITKVMDLIDLTKGQWRTEHELANKVGLTSVRIMEGLVRNLKVSFPPMLTSFINNVFLNGFIPQTFPEFKVVIKDWESVEDTSSTNLLKGYGDLVFYCIEKKMLYHICVKSVHLGKLKQRLDTKWRTWLSISDEVCPSWRLLYKPPISKRCGDLQWRLLHCIIASNSFISKLNETVLPICPFCNTTDTVFHMFCECLRLCPLFELLGEIIVKLGFSYTDSLFILGCRYKKSWQQQCTLANFLIGQAKLAIYKTHQCKNAGEDVSVVPLFKSLVKSRVVIEYTYYRHTNNVSYFEWRWGFGAVLVNISEAGNLVFNW